MSITLLWMIWESFSNTHVDLYLYYGARGYEVWNHHVGKQMSLQCLQRNVWCEISVSCLHKFGTSKYRSEWYADPYVKLCWFHPIASNPLVYIMAFHEKMWDYFECSFPPYQNPSGVLQTELGLDCKQNVAPIILFPISVFGSPTFLGLTVAVNGMQTIGVRA